MNEVIPAPSAARREALRATLASSLSQSRAATAGAALLPSPLAPTGTPSRDLEVAHHRGPMPEKPMQAALAAAGPSSGHDAKAWARLKVRVLSR